MKKVKLNDAQFAWLASVMQQHYSKAHAEVVDLTSPQTISYYIRNDAEHIRLRSLAAAQSTMRFLEGLRDAIV